MEVKVKRRPDQSLIMFGHMMQTIVLPYFFRKCKVGKPWFVERQHTSFWYTLEYILKYPINTSLFLIYARQSPDTFP